MKNYLFLILSVLSFSTLLGQNEIMNGSKASLIVEVLGLSSDKGEVLVGLYNEKSKWLSEIYMGEASQIVDGKATVVFRDLPVGVYAVSAFHDENTNKELDTNLIGIPTEAYAASRDAKGFFGPPRWNDAKFNFKASITIKLNF